MHPVLWAGCAIICSMLVLVGDVLGASLSSRRHPVAQNFAVARTAVHEALQEAAKQAASLPAGQVWFQGAEQCLTPVQTSSCTIAFNASGLLSHVPAYWEPLQDEQAKPRWQILLQDNKCFIYGEVTAEEMTSIGAAMRNSLSTTSCRKGTDQKLHCMPPLLQMNPDGSTQDLPLPTAIQSMTISRRAAGIVVSVIHIVP